MGGSDILDVTECIYCVNLICGYLYTTNFGTVAKEKGPSSLTSLIQKYYFNIVMYF